MYLVSIPENYITSVFRFIQNEWPFNKTPNHFKLPQHTSTATNFSSSLITHTTPDLPMPVSKALRRQKAEKTACAPCIRQTRMRARLSCAAPLMKGLDDRGLPIGTLPNDPLNIPYDEVLRRLSRPKIILRTNSKDRLSSESRSSASVSSCPSKDVGQKVRSDTASDRYSALKPDAISEDSEHDRLLWKMPLWRKGSIVAGPSSLMYRVKGGQYNRPTSTTSSTCSPKTIPKKRRGRLSIMLTELPRLDTSHSYIYD